MSWLHQPGHTIYSCLASIFSRSEVGLNGGLFEKSDLVALLHGITFVNEPPNEFQMTLF